MKITLQCSYHHGKGLATPGEIIDVSQAEATRLIDLGVATAAPAAAGQKSGRTAQTAPVGNGSTPPPEASAGDGGETPPPAGGSETDTDADTDNAGTGE